MGSRASVHMSDPLLLRRHARRGALHHSAGRHSTVTLPIATGLSMAMSMQTGRSYRKGHDRQPLFQRPQRADSPVGASRASLNQLVAVLLGTAESRSMTIKGAPSVGAPGRAVGGARAVLTRPPSSARPPIHARPPRHHTTHWRLTDWQALSPFRPIVRPPRHASRAHCVRRKRSSKPRSTLDRTALTLVWPLAGERGRYGDSRSSLAQRGRPSETGHRPFWPSLLRDAEAAAAVSERDGVLLLLAAFAF
jgi:hypothetical protein